MTASTPKEKTGKRDKISEIIEIKSRTLGAAHPFSVASAHLRSMSDAVDELEDVKLSIRTEWEIYRGIPVGIAATFESYFRATVAHFLDLGEPYRARAKTLKEIRLDIATILSMESQRVTLGELVAHSISFSNASDLEFGFELITGESLWPQVGPSYEAAIGQQFIIPTSPEDLRAHLYKGITEIYRVRHIVCHESRVNVDVGPNEARAFCNTAIDFLLIVEYLIERITGVRRRGG